MQRLLLLLATDAPAKLEGVLRDREAALRELAGEIGATLRLAVQVDDDPLSGPAAGDARTVRGLRGLVELTVPGDQNDALLSVVERAAATLGDDVDWSTSAASVGVVHEVLPAAADTILLTLATHRLTDIDRTAFNAYWLNVHATLAMSMLDDEAKARMGYQQLHADLAASERATELAGAAPSSFDGILQCALAQITDLPHLTVPGFAEVIMKDEENFVDQSAEMFGAFTRTLQPQGATS
jgi:hypothetical protein